ncbi:MAG: helix-turn-helix transcriptional regulator [Solobacterium sp.]|nr:helix-turn-helix transcriptional regulator [Solobacterium sp.]
MRTNIIMDAGKTGKLIQTIRTELGMRQEDLAAQLHVSRSTISKYERGRGYFQFDPEVMYPTDD